MNDSGYAKGACLHCGGHIEFPVHAAGAQIECPHCRWTTEIHPSDPSALPSPVPSEPELVSKPGSGRWVVAAGALGILLVAGLVFYARRSSLLDPPPASPTVLETPPAEPLPQGLVVSPLKLVGMKGTSLVHARGTVENRSELPRYGLKVEIKMLDAQGASLGLGSDYLDVLEPGARWEVKALVIDPKTVRAVLHRLVETE